MVDGTRSTTGNARLESIRDRIEVAPGVFMPRLGLGTWRASGEEAEEAILAAFELGYRLVDTSANYLNEEAVGRAIARSGLPREDVFVTTKLEASDHGRHGAPSALRMSLRRLGLDFVDLYLIHWPNRHDTNDTWMAMEDALREGLTRSIGVSNFEISDLEQLFETATIPPAVNQVKLHPLEQRRDLQRYCPEHGITLEAWEPVMRGRAGRVRDLVEIGRRHGKTGEQVSLRWILQKGVIAIPKSVHEARLRENADVFDFELTAEEMREIDALGA